MPQVEEFTHTKTGYSGRVRTLTLDVQLTLVPAEPSDAENAPDFRIHVGEDGDGPEVGAGWKRTGEKAGEYISLLFDDPAFTQPLRANLFQSDADNASWSLHWNRLPKRGERE
ncbi:DUF736 domain-containing protein [Mesorhizobium sp. M0977]|uniref:DUF736 domain-containing protein n=1 Tax=Mesorhizobium sp. M0977 TaxID=2957039 RepID=UPI00333AE64B